MIAVNASTSPHSSESVTPFGRHALTLVDKLGDFDCRASPRRAGPPTK